MRNDEIILSLIDFVKGGDNRDIELLEKILHEDFKNIQDGFFEKKGIFIFSKNEYIGLIKDKIFGGSPRKIDIIDIEDRGNIVIVNVKLKSLNLKFDSYIILVFQNNLWRVINNFPKIIEI